MIKASPAENVGLTVSLAENKPSITNPTEQKSVSINSATLNPADKAVVDAFIALMKSKL